MTYAPASRASWVAIEPTTPAAPCIRTLCPARRRPCSNATVCLRTSAKAAGPGIPFGPSVGHEPNAEDHPNRYENPSKRSVTIRNSRNLGHRGRSRCTIHVDHPSIAITRAYQRARNNWNFDPQGIERSTNAGGMNSLDTCNPSFQLNHVWGFQLPSITHISHSGADLKRQCELGDVDVIIDITLTLVNVTGKVIVFLHMNGSTARLTDCTSEHILMFLVIRAVLEAKLEHGFAHLRSAQFVRRETISPNTPVLKEKGSV